MCITLIPTSIAFGDVPAKVSYLRQACTKRESDLLLAPFSACYICHSEPLGAMLSTSIDLESKIFKVWQILLDGGGKLLTEGLVRSCWVLLL